MNFLLVLVLIHPHGSDGIAAHRRLLSARSKDLEISDAGLNVEAEHMEILGKSSAEATGDIARSAMFQEDLLASTLDVFNSALLPDVEYYPRAVGLLSTSFPRRPPWPDPCPECNVSSRLDKNFANAAGPMYEDALAGPVADGDMKGLIRVRSPHSYKCPSEDFGSICRKVSPKAAVGSQRACRRTAAFMLDQCCTFCAYASYSSPRAELSGLLSASLSNACLLRCPKLVHAQLDSAGFSYEGLPDRTRPVRPAQAPSPNPGPAPYPGQAPSPHPIAPAPSPMQAGTPWPSAPAPYPGHAAAPHPSAPAPYPMQVPAPPPFSSPAAAPVPALARNPSQPSTVVSPMPAPVHHIAQPSPAPSLAPAPTLVASGPRPGRFQVKVVPQCPACAKKAAVSNCKRLCSILSDACTNTCLMAWAGISGIDSLDQCSKRCPTSVDAHLQSLGKSTAVPDPPIVTAIDLQIPYQANAPSPVPSPGPAPCADVDNVTSATNRTVAEPRYIVRKRGHWRRKAWPPAPAAPSPNPSPWPMHAQTFVLDVEASRKKMVFWDFPDFSSFVEALIKHREPRVGIVEVLQEDANRTGSNFLEVSGKNKPRHIVAVLWLPESQPSWQRYLHMVGFKIMCEMLPDALSGDSIHVYMAKRHSELTPANLYRASRLDKVKWPQPPAVGSSSSLTPGTKIKPSGDLLMMAKALILQRTYDWLVFSIRYRVP